MLSIVWVWLQTGFGLVIEFIDHYNTRLFITISYKGVAKLYTLKITTAHAKSFQFALSARVVPR
jgi:hypothetical protein